jgi:RNA polymerase sigma-70 factor (ECF subfamily)
VTYTQLAVVAVAGSALLDLAVLRTRLLRRRTFWVAYAIVVVFQLLTNGVLTGARIVRYDPGTIIGWRIAYAPVEDLLFGFALVLQTLAWWVGATLHERAAAVTEPERPPVRSPVVGSLSSLSSRGALSATDERLMRELYAEHAGVLLGYVRRLLGGDSPRAEDVVQETLLRAWQHPEALHRDRTGGASVRAWLLTVARHLVIDGERARKARPQEVALEQGRDPATGDAAFEQVLAAWEVADALAALSEDHRHVIVELYYRDRSVAEAAEILGIPVGTVKSRAYYALRALRVACEERGIVP